MEVVWSRHHGLAFRGRSQKTRGTEVFRSVAWDESFTKVAGHGTMITGIHLFTWKPDVASIVTSKRRDEENQSPP